MINCFLQIFWEDPILPHVGVMREMHDEGIFVGQFFSEVANIHSPRRFMLTLEDH